MEFNKRQIRSLFLVGLILGSVLVPVAAALAPFLTNSGEVSGTIPLNASSGPNVKYTEGGRVNFTDPFPDSNTVEINSSAGNITVKGTSGVGVTIDNINGTWTNTSSLSVGTGNDLKLNPDDKLAVNVSGDADTLDFRRNMKVDDGVVDFVYSGTSGTTNVTVRGMPSNKVLRTVNASDGEVLDVGNTNSNGVVTFESMTNSEHKVEIEQASGFPQLSDPHPIGEQTDEQITELNVTVKDADFPGDTVDVEFFLDGVSQGTDSVSTDGAVASVTITAPSRGGHTVKASATDEAGNTTNLSWTFRTPKHLNVNRTTPQWERIDETTIHYTFYASDTIITKSSSTGTVNMDNLPTDQPIVVHMNADDVTIGTATRSYHNNTYVIDNTTTNNTAYMLDTNHSSVDVTFLLDDQTGGTFSENNATVRIQREVNWTTGEPFWDTVAADEFGAAGANFTLETEERYRLLVKNDDGDTRFVGTYVADKSELVTLEVGSVVAVPEGTDEEFAWTANYTNESGTNFVNFEYNDTENLTDVLFVTIFEKGNSSNRLLSNQSFGGPLGQISVTETVPSDEESKTWVVKAVADRGGNENVIMRRQVGPRNIILTGLPDWFKALISIGTIFIVAGLFSQLNGDVGALVVAGLGGMFWYVDFLPGGVEVGVVSLAMLAAGAVFISQRRGASL